MTTLLNRRGLLRLGLAAAALPGLRSMAFATGTTASPLLILVNLRGGMDGLHVLSPADEPNFVDRRPPELRTLASGTGAGHRLDASPDVDFRLYARAEGLARIWGEGRMAIWPAAGVPEVTRSHFEAQELLGMGLGQRDEGRRTAGWLASWAAASASARGALHPLSSLAAMGAMPPEMLGARAAAAVPATGDGLAMPGGAFGARMLEALHRDGRGAASQAGRDALGTLGALDRLLPRDGAGRVVPYRPDPHADYGPAREFGRGLMTVAQVAKLVPELSTATLDLGGWDMHEGQAWRMRELMGVLDAGILALDRDLRDLGRRWTVLMVSEFGRRLRSNRSGGTDHGRGGLVIAFGDPGFGRGPGRLARHLGPWPGTAPEALEAGVDVRVATDYRMALGAVVADLDPAGPVPFRQA
jgi:uncharacterized protein (DUF1501 family)